MLYLNLRARALLRPRLKILLLTVEQDNHEDGFAKDVKVRALFCRLVRIRSAHHGMVRETRVL